jgi:hypothetical protein
MKKPLTKSQRKSFKYFRSRGFSIKEARRVARLTYSQLARELSQELRRQSEAKRP